MAVIGVIHAELASTGCPPNHQAFMVAVPDFERAALPHLAAAYNLAYWLMRDRSDADDVVQDAYLRAFRAFAKHEGGDLRPWLMTIVRNVAYRALANRNRTGNVISLEDAFPGRYGETHGAADIPSDLPSPEAVLVSQGERSLVLAALAELSTAYREILILRELEGLTYREMATVIGIPTGTVMSRLARARTELKRHLEDRLDKDELNAM